MLPVPHLRPSAPRGVAVVVPRLTQPGISSTIFGYPYLGQALLELPNDDFPVLQIPCERLETGWVSRNAPARLQGTKHQRSGVKAGLVEDNGTWNLDTG